MIWHWSSHFIWIICLSEQENPEESVDSEAAENGNNTSDVDKDLDIRELAF